MYIRWNNSSKIWTTGMGRPLTQAESVCLDSNFKTTLMIPTKGGEGDVPTEVIDVLVIFVNNTPMFIYDDKDLGIVDMSLVERASIAHPHRMPVFCTPKYSHHYQKVTRDAFLDLINKTVTPSVWQMVNKTGPFTDDEESVVEDYFKTVSFNDLNRLEGHGIVFVTDNHGDSGQRYLYIETCQYNYLVSTANDTIWVRTDNGDSDVKSIWSVWSNLPWVTVSEDTDELVNVLKNNF